MEGLAPVCRPGLGAEAKNGNFRATPECEPVGPPQAAFAVVAANIMLTAVRAMNVPRDKRFQTVAFIMLILVIATSSFNFGLRFHPVPGLAWNRCHPAVTRKNGQSRPCDFLVVFLCRKIST